jgi:hypothetical protein
VKKRNLQRPPSKQLANNDCFVVCAKNCEKREKEERKKKEETKKETEKKKIITTKNKQMFYKRQVCTKPGSFVDKTIGKKWDAA